jgi:hypothetical protein
MISFPKRQLSACFALPAFHSGFHIRADCGCFKYPPTLINRLVFQLDLARVNVHRSECQNSSESKNKRQVPSLLVDFSLAPYNPKDPEA